MLDRAVILLTVAALTTLLWQVLGRQALGRARRAALPDQVLQSLQYAETAILYFSTSSCAQCRSLQAPALCHLQQELGTALAVLPVDAARETELSAQFGILTVPATVVVDRRGVRAVNLGYADAARLRQQLGATPTRSSTAA